MGAIRTKTLVSGTSQMYVLDPQEYFQRLTNLPTVWKRVRLAISLSLTAATGDNDTPVTETKSLTAGTQGLNDFLIGMSNGVSTPGNAGNKFVGLSVQAPTGDVCVGFNGSVWSIGTSTGGGNASRYSVVANGTSVGRSASAFTAALPMGVPSATSAFCLSMLLEFDCRTTNVGGCNYVINGSTSEHNDEYMDRLLSNDLGAGVVWGQLVGGGWWDGTLTNPIDLPYIYIRAPWVNNKLRIHNMAFLQVD